MNNAHPSVRVRTFPFMLSDQTLIYYSNEIQSTHNLKNLFLDNLVIMFKQKFNTPARHLEVMDEWNKLSLKAIDKAYPTASLEEQTIYLLERLQTLRLYLKEKGISAFMHKCKLLESIRDNPAFHYARLGGHAELDVLERRVQWAVSRFAGASPPPTEVTVHLGTTDDDTPSDYDATAGEVMFTDIFKRSRARTGYGQSQGSLKGGRSSFTKHRQAVPSSKPVNHNRCFVCNKQGGRAYRHSQQERIAVMRRLENLLALQATVHNIANALNAEENSDIQPSERDEAIFSNFLGLLDEEEIPDSAPHELGNANNIESFSNFISFCNNSACAYVFNGLALPPRPPAEDATNSMKERYNGRVFEGVLVGSGFSRFSTGGISQYLAYCKTHGFPLKLTSPNVQA